MSQSDEFDPRERETFALHATTLRRLVVKLAHLLFTPLMLLEVNDVGLVPSRGGVVLASNHVSNWDVFAMQLAMPRPIFFMGKAELFRFPLLGGLLRNFGAFPVYRGEKDDWALKHALCVLQAGQILGMFPEGHRSKGEGLLPAKTGAARLAIEAHCPIVPMSITGTNDFLRGFPRRARVQVSFLPRMQANQDETPEDLTDRLMVAIAQSLPEGMRGVYGERARPASVPATDAPPKYRDGKPGSAA